MQKLQFEQAWDRTLSDKDRKMITALYKETSTSYNEEIHFTPVWQAKNYKGELLITVIMHNYQSEPLRIIEQPFIITYQKEKIAENIFSLPFKIDAKTSMPWTFIFPTGSFVGFEDLVEDGLASNRELRLLMKEPNRL